MKPMVSFRRMEDGTREDYLLLGQVGARLRGRLTGSRAGSAAQARSLPGGVSGQSRLGHSLQAATRAHADGADDELLVAALIHDIGDELAPYNHAEIAAGILRPYVRPEVTWIVEQHGLVQSYYYAHHLVWEPECARSTEGARVVRRLRGVLLQVGSVRRSIRTTRPSRWSFSSRWCAGFSAARRMIRAMHLQSRWRSARRMR